MALSDYKLEKKPANFKDAQANRVIEKDASISRD